jgi:threonine dehydratase
MADGLACREPNPDALAVIRRGAERVMTVGDGAIRQAMRHLFADTHNLAEGAGAAATAALLQDGAAVAGKRVAVILSGGNVDRDLFAGVLNEGLGNVTA